MSRSGRSFGIALGLSVALSFLTAPSHAATPAWVREALNERYLRSYVELDSEPGAGEVFGRGVVLILQADAVPALPFRLTRLSAKSPRLHIRDFAPVDIDVDGRLIARPAPLTVVKGTRLVVLDLKVEADRVRLFTHTLAPLSVANDTNVYGCTEFIFRFAPTVLERGDLSEIESRIDEWVPLVERR